MNVGSGDKARSDNVEAEQIPLLTVGFYSSLSQMLIILDLGGQQSFNIQQ